MNDPDFDALWRDLLDEGADPAFAGLSRVQTLAGVRRHRRRRRLLRAGTAIGAAGVLLLVCLAAHPTAPLSAPAVANPSAKTSIAPVHFLTDEELLNRFPHRPMALIGPAEHQQLVFLDDPRSRQSGGMQNP